MSMFCTWSFHIQPQTYVYSDFKGDSHETHKLIAGGAQRVPLGEATDEQLVAELASREIELYYPEVRRPRGATKIIFDSIDDIWNCITLRFLYASMRLYFQWTLWHLVHLLPITSIVSYSQLSWNRVRVCVQEYDIAGHDRSLAIALEAVSDDELLAEVDRRRLSIHSQVRCRTITAVFLLCDHVYLLLHESIKLSNSSTDTYTVAQVDEDLLRQHYSVGECIGVGASAKVYRCSNHQVSRRSVGQLSTI